MARVGWRSRQGCRELVRNQRKLIHSESLEPRWLLAWGDFLRSVEDPGTSLQLGTETGFVVAADGNQIAAAAPMDDALGGIDIGQVHLFDAQTGALLRSITNPTRTGDGFGNSLGLSGHRLAVGSPGSSVGGPDSSGIVHLFDTDTGALLRTIVNPTPGPSDNFGAAVSLSGSTLVVGAYLDDTRGTDGGIAYVFDADTGNLLQTLAAPTSSPFDYFGYSVAVEGTTIAIGAERVDQGAVDSGVVYQFNALDGAWQRTIVNPSPANFEYFGHSIAISGNTMVISAYRDGTGAVSSGAVYVYDVRFEPLAFSIPNPAPAFADFFGGTVDISGDRIVVGARRADRNGFIDSGIAYEFSASTGLLVHTYSNPSPTSLDYYGASVAVAGNVLVISAYWDDTSGPDSGTVYIYDATTGQQTRSLFNPTLASLDYFGYAVAVDGNRVAAGAPLDDSGATDAGSVYVYDGQTGDLIRRIVNPEPESQANFGNAVALQGNLLVVGAYRKNGTANDVGAAYVFDISTGQMLRAIRNPQPTAFDYFGYSVALVNGRVAIGAYLDDAGATDAGTVYLFDAISGTLLQTLANPSPQAFDHFGYTVAISQNVVAVGAQGKSNLAPQAGTVYVLDPDSGVLMREIPNPSPASGDFFGQSLALRGTTLAVGAPRKDSGGIDAGVTYLYQALTGDLLATVEDPTANAGNFFGYSVALSERYLAVGAYQKEVTQHKNAGSVLLFDSTTGLFVQEFMAPSPNAEEYFGWGVAMSSDLLAVGTPLHDAATVDRGAIYLFDVHHNAPPVARPGLPYLVNEGTPITLDASQSYDAEDSVDDLQFAWDFNYTGDFQVDATGVAPEVTFDSAFPTRTIALRVTDSQGSSSIATTTLTVHDVPPIIAVNQGIVSVQEGGLAQNSGTFSHPVGEAITLSASIGAVISPSTGVWTWQLTPQTIADSQTVTITATDSSQLTQQVTFQLQVQPVLPVITAAVSTVSVAEGVSAANSGTFGHPAGKTVSLTATVGSVIDQGDGNWTWSYLTTSPTDSQTVTITATDSAQQSATVSFALQVQQVVPVITLVNGAVTIVEGKTATNTGTFSHPALKPTTLSASYGTVTDLGDGTWNWSATPNSTGDSQSVTITATDSAQATRTVTFDLVVIKSEPVITQQSNSIVVLEQATATNSGTFSHTDGKSVTLMASLGDVVDAGGGHWGWTYANALPTSGQEVTITATDSDQVARSVTFTVKVNPVLPVVTVSQPSVTVQVGETASNSGTQAHALSKGMALSASLGSVVDQGDGTWSWSYVPLSPTSNPETVTISATDNSGNIGVQSFELTVESTIPVVAGDLNGDGAVDASDASIQFGNWGGSGLGDLNQDGIIDAADAGILFANWTGDSITDATSMVTDIVLASRKRL